MEKVKCNNCNFEMEKPQWEHIINALYRAGGHAGNNTCPKCKNNALEFYFAPRNYNAENIDR